MEHEKFSHLGWDFPVPPQDGNSLCSPAEILSLDMVDGCLKVTPTYLYRVHQV